LKQNILYFFTTICLLFLQFNTQAQQNCFNAIAVCQNSYTQSAANLGVGSLNELNTSNQGCLTNGEVNSTWYIINTTTAGNLVFTITPTVATADYDFAIWDITDTSCAAIGNGLPPIRCNYASLANSSAGGLTGLSTAAGANSYGAAGPSFSNSIAATGGQTFAILINNSLANTNGYTIDFSGSTAQILDNTSPTIKNITVPPSCTGPTKLKITLKENIKCATLSASGSEFTVSGGASVTSANSTSCSSGGVFTSVIYVNLAAPLSPGTYTCTINNGTDGNTLTDNCNNNMLVGTSFTFVVIPPVAVQISPSFGCSGTATGSITATGIGGTPPYQYKLNAGAYSAANTFNGLTASTYTVFVKDSIGCIHDTIITLAASPPIIINTVVTTNLICFNANTGQIMVTASGGAPPLQYSANVLPYTASNTITGLGPGIYVVHVKDANGCIKDTNILLTSPGPIVISSANINNVTCLGGNNGSILIQANGGTTPITYALNTGAYNAFANYTNLVAGTYTVHIKDGNNCIKDTVINITQPANSLSAQIISTVQPSCVGSSGSIVGGGAGGIAPYTYSLNGTNYFANATFTGLASGSYSLYVKDAGGCVATVTVLLVSPGNLFFNGATVLQPTCLSTGSILVTGLGGVLPYTFANGAGVYGANNNFTGLPAGSYTMHVKDNNGCIHDTIITLLTPLVPFIAVTNVVNTTCTNPNIGSITVAGSGGVSPYTFSLNGGAFTNITSYGALSAGTYTITVKGANGCTQNITATILNSNTVNFATFTKTNIGCSGTPLGTITSSGTGGASPYTFNINGGVYGASGSFTGLSAGTYTIIVKDASGCTKSSVTIINTSANLGFASCAKTNATCSNPGNGSITGTSIGGVAPINLTINSTFFTQGTTNGFGPGTYTLMLTDANGCTVTCVQNITGPPPLYPSNTVVIQPLCFNGLGSISTSAIGGLPPYTYALNTGAYTNTANYTNLTPGTYVVHIQDANGCIHDTTIVLLQPPPIVLSNLVIVNAACTGGATGSFAVTGSGTTPPYSYSINGGAFGTANTFTNLAVGTYTVIIKDGNNCTNSIVQAINNNGNFYFGTSSYVIPSCVGSADGSIVFTGSGGSTPFTFKINAGAYQVSNSFTGLLAGTYTLYVKDNNGCVVTNTVTIPNPVPLSFTNITINPPLCNNLNTGSVTFTASGGTAPYTYKIDAGLYSITNTYLGLAPGTHTISIKDAKNCIRDSIISIFNPTAISVASSSVINPGCFGAGGGSIAILGNGGTAPYTYALNAGAYSISNSFPGIPIGIYTVHIKDANNCIKDTIITLTNATSVAITSVLKTNPNCPTANTGSITVASSSPNLPLTYSLNGAAPVASGFFTNLGIGTYTIQVQDGIGCYRDTIISLSSISALVLNSVTVGNLACANGTNGSITINATATGGAINYALNTGAYTSFSTFNSLSVGTYTVHTQDVYGCIKDTIINITAPPALQFANVLLTAPFCNGSLDGSISIGATGGVSPFQYSINGNPFSNINNFTNLSQGNYTFQVNDANNCVTDSIIFLQAPITTYFSSINISNISCFGASNGAITVAASGGVAPYTYSFNNSPYSIVNNYSNLPAGSYSVSAIDNGGCKNDTIINLTAPNTSVAISFNNIVNNKCRGDSAGSITAIGNGGLAPYFFSLNNNANFSSVNIFNNLVAGTYTIYIQDANGCQTFDAIIISEPDSSNQIVFVGTQKNSCIGVNDATLIVTTSNGIPPLTFSLNGVNKGIDTLYANLAPGNYVVEVIDSLACISSGKYFVDSSTQKPSILITDLNNNNCANDLKGSFSWSATDVYLPYTSAINSTSVGTNTSTAGLANGTYLLEITDNKGCFVDTLIQINYTDSVKVEVIAIDAKCTGLGNDGSASATIIYGAQPITYNWSNNNTLNVNTVNNIEYGVYTLTVTDNAGCTDTAAFKIDYVPCCNVWVPNAFSPNNDLNNEFIFTSPSGPVSFLSFAIFNRFGEKVFEGTDFNSKWNGTFNGNPCDMGTYFYIVRYKCPLANEILMHKGDITLIR
jgi:large repetitive protein